MGGKKWDKKVWRNKEREEGREREGVARWGERERDEGGIERGW